MALSLLPGTNCWTKAEDRIANHLSTLVSFQQFLGVVTSDAAKSGNMYYGSTPRPSKGDRDKGDVYSEASLAAIMPMCVIGTLNDTDDGIVYVFRASGPAYARSGLVEVQLLRLIDQDLSEADDERKWTNQVGDIIDELLETRAQADIQAVNVRTGRNQDKEWSSVGEIHAAYITLRWGVSVDEGV